MAWDSSTSGFNTGRDTETGWGPYDAFSTVNGAYWKPSQFSDAPSGDAAAITIQAAPGIESRYVALWLDMSSPGSAKSGYQLRWTATPTANTYNVTLAKWSAGVETVLASKAAVSLPVGTTMAISDTGGTLAAWQGAGGSLSSIASAADSSLSGGYAGVEASGSNTRLLTFKAGSLGSPAPPDTTVSGGPSGVTVPRVSLSFTASEGGASFECSLDGAAYGTCVSPKAYEGLAEGSHAFSVRATGPGGADATPAQRTFKVVGMAKAVTKTALLDDFGRSEVPLATGKWSKSSWAVEIGGSWLGSFHGYGANSGLAGAYWNPSQFSDGGGSVLVSAAVGTGSTPAGQYTSLWLDSPGPGSARSGYEARFTGVNSSASNYTVELSKWVAGTRTVLASTVGFSLPLNTTMALSETAGGSLAIWTGSGTVSPVLTANDSTYTGGYAGIDVNGGAGTAYNFRAGRIDIEPPNTTIQNGPSGTVPPGPVSFAFSASESGSSFECSLDGGAYGGCSSPKEYPSLAGGSHAFRVRAVDAAGNVDETPAERGFQIVKPPVVSTEAATAIKASEATLRAGVNPENQATTYQFEYGATASYDSKVPASAKAIGSGGQVVAVGEPIAGLQPWATYHFRIVATNAAGTSQGMDRTFTTPAAPVATTKAATAISAREATLKATVDPRGAATTYRFEYGTTASYGSKVPASSKSVGSGIGAVEVGENVQGLAEGTTYHYRVVAENEVGISYGADMTLATPLLPEAETEEAESVAGEEAILTGSVDPNGASTEYDFEYGTSTAYGTTIAPDEAGDGTAPVEASESIGALQPETTYHYRIVGTSQAGADYGEDKAFTTGAASSSGGSTPLPGDFFGMMWTGDLGQTSYPNVLSAVKNSGSRVLRLALYRGAVLQPKYEEIFRAASHRGITVLPYLGDGVWPTDPGTQGEWKSFAREMVQKYGPGGTFWGGGGHPVVAWEIWNEPNLPTNSPFPNPAKLQSPQAPYEKIGAEQFGNFFHKVAEGLKEGAGGHNIEILAPGLFGFGATNCDGGECHLSPASFLGQMAHTGDYDAVSLHPYVFKVKGQGSTPHAPTGPNQVTEVKEKIENYIRDVRNKLGDLNEPNKKIWVTELGFPVRNDAGDTDNFPPVTEAVQKEEIEAAFGMMKAKHDALGIAHAIYYNIQDFRCSQWEHEKYGCAVGEEHPTWDAHSGVRKGPGGNRLGWKGFASVAPKGHPSWSSAKRAKNTQTNRKALSALPTYAIETQGARYEARAEWGGGALSSSYPNPTAWQVVEAQDEGEGEEEPVEVEASTTIPNLLPEHVYHYRIAVKNENGEIETEATGHEFETKPLVSAAIRPVNGEPGWVNVTGHVESNNPLNNTWVNVNFKKKEGGVYVFKPEESTHAELYNSDYSLVNWRIGRGEWQVNVVFEGNAETPRGETGLEALTVKNAYHLVARHSGKCLEVSSGGSADGTSIRQEPCGDGHTQQAQAFTLVPSPYNPIQYELVNRNSGKCLDVSGASQADGAQVQQYTCVGWGQTNQVFEGVPVSPSDTSHVNYIAQHSHKCLDVPGASTADGALLQQWSCTGASNQAFGFESVDADPVPTHTYVTLDETFYGHPGYETFHGSVEAPQSVAGQKAYVNFKKKNGSGFYEYIDQAEVTLNAAGQYSFPYWGVGAGDWEVIAIYPGSGNMAESRTPEAAHRFHVGDGYRFEFRQPHKCVSDSANGTGNGTAIIQWDCSPNPSPGDGQVYSVEPVAPAGSNNFRIRPDSNTNMCLDVAGGPGAIQNGVVIQLWGCFEPPATNQVWHIVELGSPNNGWFSFLAQNSGRCMTVNGGSTANGARFIQWDCAWAGSQQWRWLPVG